MAKLGPHGYRSSDRSKHQTWRARCAALEAALKPFANIPIPLNGKPHWPINYTAVTATYADVQRARDLLEHA